MRCPYQCGVKVLVRNLEKHKKSCTMRQQQPNAEGEGSVEPAPHGLPSPSTSTGKPTIPPTNKMEHDKRSTSDYERDQEVVETTCAVGSRPGQGDPSRMVTCMRCQESMPFLLVPSHGPKCKGKGKKENEHEHHPIVGEKKVAAPPSQPPPPPVTSTSEKKEPFSGSHDQRHLDLLPKNAAKSEAPESSPPATAHREAADGMSPSRERALGQSPVSRSYFSPKSPPALPTSSDLRISSSFPARLGAPLSPPAVGTKAWQMTLRTVNGASAERHPEGSMNVPVSPPRPKDARAWGTRQVTSWLREIMRPPRADIIARFHDSGVIGTTLLGVTDRCTDRPRIGAAAP